jgi:hypothetical protein
VGTLPAFVAGAVVGAIASPGARDVKGVVLPAVQGVTCLLQLLLDLQQKQTAYISNPATLGVRNTRKNALRESKRETVRECNRERERERKRGRDRERVKREAKLKR